MTPTLFAVVMPLASSNFQMVQQRFLQLQEPHGAGKERTSVKAKTWKRDSLPTEFIAISSMYGWSAILRQKCLTNLVLIIWTPVIDRTFYLCIRALHQAWNFISILPVATNVLTFTTLLTIFTTFFSMHFYTNIHDCHKWMPTHTWLLRPLEQQTAQILTTCNQCLFADYSNFCWILNELFGWLHQVDSSPAVFIYCSTQVIHSVSRGVS